MKNTEINHAVGLAAALLKEVADLLDSADYHAAQKDGHSSLAENMRQRAQEIRLKAHNMLQAVDSAKAE